MKKKIINAIAIIFLLIAIGCIGYLAYYFYSSAKSESEIQNLQSKIVSVDSVASTDSDQQTEMVNVDGVMVQKKFEQIYRENHDFVGWLNIQDTMVDYPVMYTPYDTENGQYYIHKNFDGKYSAAGLPFMDKNCTLELPTDNVIIYGHNMNAGTMFHDIIQYADSDFYAGHKTFTFDSIYEDGTYEVIAMFYGQILDENSTAFKYYEFVNAGSEQEFMDFVTNVKKMSVIDTGVDVKYGDKLLTLSTCAYHVKDGRFAVIAKKQKKD